VSLERATDLLACPVCQGRLALYGKVICCTEGHSYDVAKQGYVNLLGASEPGNADTSEMLDARARVHAAGVFNQVTEAIATSCGGRQRVLEAGAGTGHYLASALGTDPQALGVAIDVSKASAKHCVRTDERIAAIVADVWQPLPLRDRSLDAVLAVFAPRNLPEFARVLHSDGRFIAVTPRSGHLVGLRDAYGLLDIPSAKATQLAAAAAEFFDLIDTRVIKYRVPVDEQLATDLIAMGPNAFHQQPKQVTASVISIDVTVQSFRPIRD
jgi:23S rRNA (guanine745-N1)-methyltransferase